MLVTALFIISRTLMQPGFLSTDEWIKKMWYFCICVSVCVCVCVLCLVTQLCPTLCDPTDCSSPDSFVHWDSPSKNIRVGCHALLHGIFPTQQSNSGIPHCRLILQHLSHQGPRILEWVAYPFSRMINAVKKNKREQQAE